MNESDGTIPSLNDGLGEPVASKTGKTNLSMLITMIVVALAAVSLIAGSFYYLLTSGGEDDLVVAIGAGASESPNIDINSKTIDNKQAQIKEQLEIAKAAKVRDEKAAKRLAAAEQVRLLEEVRSAAVTKEYEFKRDNNDLAATRAKEVSRTQVSSNEKRPLTPYERKRTGAVFFDLGSTGNSGSSGGLGLFNSGSSDGSRTTDDFNERRDSGGQGESVFGQTATTFSARSAGRLPDLDYLLKTGTTIPCAPVTKINTTFQGLVICRLTNDIYSANGNTLLLERGATATGQQTQALLNGQARVFVLWTRIDNPSGVTIDIDSPSAGQLGASGVEAFVDNHFWKRFGTAILVSLIDDVSGFLIARESARGDGAVFSSTTASGSELSTEILEQQANIPPTGIVNNAKVINIIVARDVSFDSVYRLLK